MSTPLEFHPAVRDEIDDAHDWDEQRRPGLGSDFLDELGRVLADISANPDRFGIIAGDIRAGLTNRFPYAVSYRVLPDRVRVLPVYHAARDPSGGQSLT